MQISFDSQKILIKIVEKHSIKSKGIRAKTKKYG